MDDALSALTLIDVVTLFFAFATGGFIKGLVGMGLPMIAVPILSTVFDPRTAIAAMILPIMGANFLQARAGGLMGRTIVDLRALLIPMVLGSIVGTLIITAVRLEHAAVILGSLVSIFALTTLFGWKPLIPPGIDRRLRPAIGAVAGVIGGMSSFFAPTIAPYLFSLGLDKAAFVRAMGVTFLIGETPLFLGLTLKGFAPGSIWALSAVGWAVVGLFMYFGSRLRDRIPQAHFMKLVGVMLLLVGLNMIRRAVF